ncbi:MAG: class I SAM-dependent methyltransferase [Pseudomonadota bacterium]
MATKTKELADKTEGLQEVQEHYMDYPYPFRDPEDEKRRLLSLMGEYLGELNHWLYNGKKNFKKGFRVLVAGGGTGDSSTYMGEQLKDTDAEIVYLDFSRNSMEIAKQRAEIRGIKNITWINDSILNIPKLNLGKFDYINCSGVLHHLESPAAGLKILQEALKDDGGMCVMVYGKYGRTGVYQVQDIMKMVNEGVNHRVEEVMNGKAVMNSLPDTNWYMRGRELLADHITFGDIGLYDLFLHKQDRSYSIPELHEFITDAGLNFVEFFDLTERLALRIENYIKDFSLLQKIKKMSLVKQQAICELICGTVIKHSVYLTKNKKNTIASFEDMNNIPYFYTIAGLPEQISDFLENNPGNQSVTTTINNSWLKNIAVTVPVDIYTKSIFKNMIGKPKSFKEIFDAVRKDLKIDTKDSELINVARTTLSPFIAIGVVLIKDKAI